MGTLTLLLAVGGIAFALGELLLSAFGAGRPHVSIKGWAAGFAACVLINRWTHAPGVTDVQWLHYMLIGAGVVLTLLWLNEPDRFSSRRG